ncbi:tRNA pseudouridine(38-40) synthase TruA [Ancylobacter dichloromethanicus]|uniref:tRNA pseudouridine synthase A n=1 Tax=Ancylobacter dichloromethanicus TaxID=518825 RepID=A0A9W6JC13_9HYPH|nr:tRNA pseudouridine(38-40) synthase TruA [Ancylobacter dichloromethanicus]MBS7554852.1 tRNA pseudouridine(38-40) synthase TruA [Ancylobacter dichloromethanicus]GLK73244.1 tRNA pseudouridine synthase A [Ancylobacter dichloromethanicus]
MPRYKLTIEYDGTPFVGWQIQATGESVQGVLARAVKRFSGEEVTVHGAGRTDAGVHATGQVAHVELSRDWKPDTVRDAMNAHLRPHPVAVLSAEPAGEDFHARFSATGRRYLYRIIARRPDLVLERNRAWRVQRPLDADAMAQGAARLIGRHDFTTFRAIGCQAASPVKTLDRLAVEEVAIEGPGMEIRVHAQARSFLHHQVRSLVGTLVKVGEGAWTPDDVSAALEAKDRTRCGPMAPSAGLYLAEVTY